jgi:hypothetical protein
MYWRTRWLRTDVEEKAGKQDCVKEGSREVSSGSPQVGKE